MTEGRRWVAPQGRMTAWLGVAVGVAVSAQPVLSAVAAVGLGATFLAVSWPMLLVALMWTGMLFDRMGITGMAVDDFPVTASKLTVLFSCGAWAVHAGLRGVRPVRWHPVLGAILAMVAVTALSIVHAGSMEAGRFDLFGLVMMTVLVALVYAVLAEASLQSLYRLLALVFAGVLLASVGRVAATGEAGRATGTMGDPNEWATTVLLLTPFLLGGLVDDEGAAARPLRMALLLLAPLAILRSESRAALAVCGMVAPACLYLVRRRTRELGVCAALAGVAGPLVVDLDKALHRFRLLTQNVGSISVVPDDSFTERLELFRQGRELFFEHWFLGAGPGMFAMATGFVSSAGTLRPAHNTYLQVASEQGVVGLSVLGVFGITVAATLRRGFRQARDLQHRNRVAGIVVGLGAFAAMAATLGLLTFAIAWLVLGFALAVVHQATRSDDAAR